MALVGYSDSEESESEVTQVQSASQSRRIARTEDRKIKVDLPSTKADAGDGDLEGEPIAKRQKRAGAFSGFNSLLPAPKRAAQSSVRPGVSLRTSSEAAFSRVPAPQIPDDSADAPAVDPASTTASTDEPAPALVGKSTRFLPLSVANAKKKKRPVVNGTAVKDKAVNEASQKSSDKIEPVIKDASKPSLFSFSNQDGDVVRPSTTPYEPEFVQSEPRDAALAESAPMEAVGPKADNALAGVASDLNLSSSERRRLFGRAGVGADVHIAHFDMNTEYQSNQDLAARGEVVEHRTVRAIAPGRHSLQQLVANVKGQTEALEDKWAEGRRNRGETGSKYGW